MNKLLKYLRFSKKVKRFYESQYKDKIESLQHAYEVVCREKEDEIRLQREWLNKYREVLGNETWKEENYRQQFNYIQQLKCEHILECDMLRDRIKQLENNNAKKDI